MGSDRKRNKQFENIAHLPDFNDCIKSLESHGVIIYMSDTIPALGCLSSSEKGIHKLNVLKKRKPESPYISLVSSLSMLEQYAEIPPAAYELLQEITDPLTIIYPKGYGLPEELYAGDGGIAFRIIKSGPLNQLIKKLKKPLVSTSVNISGELATVEFNQIPENILQQVDYILNLPSLKQKVRKKPSPIIKFQSDGSFHIIRK